MTNDELKLQYSKDVEEIGTAALSVIKEKLAAKNYDKVTNFLIMGRVILGMYESFFNLGLSFANQKLPPESTTFKASGE